MKRFLLLIIPLCLSVSVYTQNKKVFRATIERMKSDSTSIQNQLQKSQNQLQESQNQLQESQNQLQKSQNQLQKSQNQLQEFKTLSNDLKLKIDALEKVRLLKQNQIDSLLNLLNINSTKIGDQFWTTENLNVDKFRNGDTILHAKTNDEWDQSVFIKKEPAWCYYENNTTYGVKYGKLYNWYAVNDPRGLAPLGWRIPSESDWEKLANHLGGEVYNVGDKSGIGSGDKLKSEFDWDNRDLCISSFNETGFSALPAGMRYWHGKFEGIHDGANWWSSDQYDNDGKKSEYVPSTAFIRFLYNRTVLWRYACDLQKYKFGKSSGYSVRCVRDN
jgi:uncharacterized protein (TIGR02145 family)